MRIIIGLRNETKDNMGIDRKLREAMEILRSSGIVVKGGGQFLNDNTAIILLPDNTNRATA
jgi:hypothetical protein